VEKSLTTTKVVMIKDTIIPRTMNTSFHHVY